MSLPNTLARRPPTAQAAITSRPLLFRVGAVLLALLPFLLIEMALRWSELGRADLHDDPFVGFSSIRPLFVRNEAGDRFEIPPARTTHFFPESFAATKPADEFRVFAIGDSTVQGNPWGPDTSFTKWLEISLNAAEPARRWRVINCGGISYASYRMVPIVEEVLQYQPDLLIVHCSHNEFLEDRTYGDLKRTPRLLWRLHEQVAQLRLYHLLRAVMLSSKAWLTGPTASTSSVPAGPRTPRPLLTTEVQALLDYRGGLEFYHRDAKWHRDVVAHYEHNLRRMVSMARFAGVPLILMNPACNLRDSPPFKAEHRPGMTDSERQRWQDLWEEARAKYLDQPRLAIPLLRAAVAIDGEHAGLRYDLAKCLDAAGQYAEARAEYVQAKEHDVCPLRILSPMNEIVRQIGQDTGTPVVDVGGLFDRISRHQIPGNEWFADHVHPTIPGYQRVADELANEMVRRGFVTPQADWLALKQRRSEEHLDSLPTIYFLTAEERLAGLMLWAHGRVTRERPQQPAR